MGVWLVISLVTYAHIVKTLNLKVEYVFQLKAYVNTWYLYASSITNGHLLDLWLMSGYSKVLSEQSLDSDKRCC